MATEVEKRTAAFEFPGVDGAYVQDNGAGPRKFPMVCFFSGGDCDLQASAFEGLLLERGEGRLEHPLYGKKNVVPFGSIGRRDDLVTAANQAVVEVTFWSTLGAVYPSSGLSAEHELSLAITTASAALAGGFERKAKLDTVARKANAKLTVGTALKNVQGALGKVAAVNSAVNREFRDLQQEINFGMDVLIGTPLLLAQQTLNLITAPGRALAGIVSRLEAYADLLDRMINSSEASGGDQSVLPALRVKLANNFHTADLFASGALLGSLTSVGNNRFAAKPEALAAADAIVAQADDLTAWQDQRNGDIEQIDTGEGYQALQEATALAVGFLVEISFSLVPERFVILDRPRNIIELAAELYGEVDARLDFLVSTNKLTGSSIIEVPRGRRILYYA